MPQLGADHKISELIVLCDEGGAIRFVSRSFARFFGTPVDVWHGQTFAPGSHAASPGRPAQYRTSAKAAGRDVAINWTETVLRGGERLYAGAPTSLTGGADDAPAGAQPASSGREPGGPESGEEPEGAAGANNAGLNLLATMSHEMRTPLNGILGMTNLLLDTELTANQRSYAASVRESGAALLALINDLLDYSKMESGRFELEQSVFSLGGLLQNVGELLSPKAADKNVEIATFVDPRIPEKLFGDEARLRQVFLNLAGNGVKFTDAGGVCVEAKLLGKKNGEARVLFEVRDTGIGIPDHMLGAIFEEFAQADSGEERKREGTGLGLPIARKIVRSMNGDISVQSAEGRGSVFSFELTLAFDEEHRETPLRHECSAVVATRNPVLAHVMGQQMRALGAKTVTVAKSASEALGALAAHPEAILLCDLDIAEAGGAALAGSGERSFVLVSPYARSRIKEMRAQGFDGFFIKPVRQHSLFTQIAGGGSKEQENPEQQTLQAAAPPSGPLRVLLAEDNQINAVLATTIIKRAGHFVDVAKNGEEAVSAHQSGAYDVVLMDLHMPEVDGLEAARRIRALAGPKSRTPIIALTASANASDREKCAAAGMDGFITKPFEPEELETMLTKWGGAESAYKQAS